MSQRASSARQRSTLVGLVIVGVTLVVVLWLIPHDTAGGSPASHATQAAGPHAALLGSRTCARSPGGACAARERAPHAALVRLAHAPTAQQIIEPISQPAARFRPVGCVRRGAPIDYTHGPRRREVALTFDDGPYPITPSFVRMLHVDGAVATFFTIGEQLTSRYRSTLHEELRDGDVLGDHTYTHPDLVTTGGVRGQLQSTLRAIRNLSGYTPCVFRPPDGAYDSAIVHTAASLGLATVTWEVDPSDYALPGSAAIRARVLAQVRPGSIVISHDGGGPREQTLAAYPGIIAALRSRGYRFVTVPELLGFHAVYRRCLRTCDGAAITGRPPPGSILEPG